MTVCSVDREVDWKEVGRSVGAGLRQVGSYRLEEEVK